MVIVMFDVEAGHEEKLTDHVSTVVPTVSPVIVEVGEREFVIVPGPETFIHLPVPTTGLFPASVAVPAETQMVWFGPARAVEGPTVNDILEELTQVPLVMVHMKVLMPAVNPVIEVVGESEFVMVPLPEIFVQVPVPPPVAVFAAITGTEPTHSVRLGPAFAIWHCDCKVLGLRKNRQHIKTRMILFREVKLLLGVTLKILPNKSK